MDNSLKTYVVAVSGGIDSMCLLHMIKDQGAIVVAHFNHGTRPSADDDEKFVREWAKKYGLPCHVGRAKLGPNVSEAEAREARYKFLKKVVKKYDGILITAQHTNDMFESVVINFLRGTGWRGLTPFFDRKIARPLGDWTKSNFYHYAAENQIVFRQDPTNNEDKYLRNRIRPKVSDFVLHEPKKCDKLLALWLAQVNLRREIEAIASEILPSGRSYPRELFDNLDDAVAEEIIRAIFRRYNISATRPKMQDFLQAIRTYEPGKKFNLPKGRFVRFNKTEFML